MTFYELTTLSAGIFHLILTVFVLSRDLRSSVNRTYCLWGGSLTLWNLAGYLKYQASQAGDQVLGMWLLRLLHLSVVFLPASTFHLFFLIARIHKPRLLTILYCATIGFAASVFTPLYFAGIRESDYGYVAEGGPAFYAFMGCYFITAVVTITMLRKIAASLFPIHRARLRAFGVAYIFLAVAGLHDLFPVLGYKYYPFLNLKIHPLGNLTAIFFGIVMAYSVLHHQLLDIHVSLSHLAAQMVRIAFLFLLSFALLTLLFWIAPRRFTTFSFFSALGVFLVTAGLTPFLFPKFFGEGEEKLEQRLLGDRFEYQEQVRGFIQAIPSYIRSEALLRDLNPILVKTMGVSTYQIILLGEGQRAFALAGSYPDQPHRQITDLTVDSPLFRLFASTRPDYLAYPLAYSIPGETGLERAAREQLQPFNPEFCFPFMSGEDPFGLLIIGKKANGEPYTAHDLQLLVEMVKSLSLVLNQIRLKDQLLLAEEMELLGLMSRGIAHDLNNLLTPVWTYFQLASAGVNHREMNEELLPTAMSNLETVRTYVREALFFARTQTLQLKTMSLDRIIQSALALAQADLKARDLKVVVEAPAEATAEMDEILIQRLIGNLLSNAIDASRPGAQLQLKLLRLPKTETSREWWRLLVIDHGEGISRENLKRVATPYFTTKDRGDNTRGFGLGLAICRKIVHLHGGHMTIRSEERKGTTVQVDLPDRQLDKASQAASLAK
jgi:signal transduction histidine kinase